MSILTRFILYIILGLGPLIGASIATYYHIEFLIFVPMALGWNLMVMAGGLSEDGEPK